MQHKPTNSCLRESLNSHFAQVDGNPDQHCLNSWKKQVLNFATAKMNLSNIYLSNDWSRQTLECLSLGVHFGAFPVSSQKCTVQRSTVYWSLQGKIQ